MNAPSLLIAYAHMHTILSSTLSFFDTLFRRSWSWMLVSLNLIVKAGHPLTHFQPWWVEDSSERGPSDMHWPFQAEQERIPAGRQKPFSDRESTIAMKACLHIAFVCSHWTKQQRHKATLILYCDWDPDPPFIAESKTFFLLKNASHIRH